MGVILLIPLLVLLFLLLGNGAKNTIEDVFGPSPSKPSHSFTAPVKPSGTFSDTIKRADEIRKKYPQGYRSFEEEYLKTLHYRPSVEAVSDNESIIVKYQEIFDIYKRPKLIKKADELRSLYPLGYQCYVNKSLTAPIDTESALKATEKEDLIIAKQKELTSPSKPTLSDYSPNKYKGVSFMIKEKYANQDIKVYKVLRSKNPNKYNHFTQGEYRSFETPDQFMSFNIGETATSRLTLNEFVPDYELSSQLDQGHEKIVGIVSYKYAPSYNACQYYTVALYECFIPRGSHYHEGYKNGELTMYLSNQIVVRKLIDSIS